MPPPALWPAWVVNNLGSGGEQLRVGSPVHALREHASHSDRPENQSRHIACTASRPLATSQKQQK